ncbi:MAG: hypothetical protein OYG31_02855 [Candidatus Kaiserbacteria bacterium]|nr:hypothetical protein [Candidatus Kaiserbacteria bacterium]
MRLLSIAVILLVVVTITYAGIRSQTLFFGPPITITTPAAHAPVPQVLTVVGQTDQATYLAINDQRVHPNLDGHFEHTLVLPVGYTVIQVYTRNRHAREHVIHLPIDVYDSIQEEIK